MKEILINAAITIIISAITGYFSSKIAYNREIKRRIYDEREKAYITLFKLIEKLKGNLFLVYNSTEFLIPFGEIKAKLNLYASQEVLNIVSPFNDKVNEISKKYFELFDSVEAHRTKEARLEQEDVTELELLQEEELYMEKNVIDKDYVDEVFLSLISQIRQELKTE
jgi:hypothetical protein